MNWTALSLLVSTILAVGGLYYTGRQVVDQQKVFVRTNQQSQYNDILAGLSSQSSAAQISAVSRLIDFVEDPKNFSSTANQKTVGLALQRTLVEFIASTAADTSQGLGEYNKSGSKWRLAVTATRQLEDLLNNPQMTNVSLASIDLSHVDMHGYSQQNLKISANLSLDGVDLREATLAGIQISPDKVVNLEQADLTCADLYGKPGHRASLGRADLRYADLTGANLSDLDLRSVSNLTRAQIRHATWNPGTLWPSYLNEPDPMPATDEDAMQSVHGLCTYVIDRMTGMMPGEGYQNTTPYPFGSNLTSVQKHALTVEAVREGCLRRPLAQKVDPQILFDKSDASVGALLGPCGG
jgi:uncharacterized protein YjbI with pentapeptide repeats